MMKVCITGILAASTWYAGAQLQPIEAEETQGNLVTSTNESRMTTPIEDFRVAIVNDMVQITWVCEQPENTRGFLVEKSPDGLHYESLVYVAIESEMNGRVEFFETDSVISPGTSFYRIRQVLGNGHESVAAIAAVKSRSETDELVDEFGNYLIKVDFSGFENEETLVILRDKKGFEYFSKLYVVQTGSAEKGVRLEPLVPPGEYTVTASSNDQFLAHKLEIE